MKIFVHGAIKLHHYRLSGKVYGKCSKISLSVLKLIWWKSSGPEFRIANREDPDQTASEEEV